MTTPPIPVIKTPPKNNPDHVTAPSRALASDDLSVTDPDHNSTQDTQPAPTVSKLSTYILTTIHTTTPLLDQIVQSIIQSTFKSTFTLKPITLELQPDSLEDEYTKGSNYLKLPPIIRHYHGPKLIPSQGATLK